MTALAMERMSVFERWTYQMFTLAAGTKAYKNGIAVIALGTGRVRPGRAAATDLVIGKFNETVDATAGEKLVHVNLGVEIEVEWWDNSAAAPVAATDVGQLCYVEDDQTVSMTATGTSVAGRVWRVEAGRGVAVQKLLR